MKAKISFIARVGQAFVLIEIKNKKTPVAPAGATSYYARFTEDSKRVCKPLGKDFTGAFIAFRNLEIAREFKSRNLPVPFELVNAPLIEVPRTDTLAQRIDDYSVRIKSNKAHRTWQAYMNSLALFSRHCKRATIQEITCDDLFSFKTFLRGEKFGDRSIYNNFLNTMVFLKWCGIKTGIKSDDWPRQPSREPEAYTDDEINAMLNVATAEERLLINCFLCSGMRSGELAHLTYGDIDFEHSTWTVQPKNGWYTKTERSQRDVPVPVTLTAKIKERMVRGSRNKSDYIFFNRNGAPNLHMLRITKAVAKRAQITGRVDDHKFRSTAVTRWLRDGNTVTDVMGWVGHVNPEMILRYAAKVNVRRHDVHNKATRSFEQFVTAGD